MPPEARSQAAAAPARASLAGRVVDSQGHAVAGATVKVTGNQSISTQTDPEGKYFVSSLAPGAYQVQAEAAKYESAVLGPVTMVSREAKTLDIILHAKASKEGSSLGTPEFFDQPQFTIAGVTDTTNLGGHASGMTGPTESLTKDVNSLADPGPAAMPDAAQERSARALADSPGSGFNENHAAGTLLLNDGKPHEAIRYLSRAAKFNPSDSNNSYELARAYAGAGEYSNAHTLINAMLAEGNSAALHHLLAIIEEKSGNALKAEAEFQEAARLDRSEPNLFDWGMELLTHHAIEPAIAVFRNGNARFPQSARMLSGLAAASYEGGAYDQALQYVCAASDLNPSEAGPYLLLGKMQNADHGESAAALIRLRRFAQLQPENALANYYYALALWKRRTGTQDASTSEQVESLLQKVLRLDPHLAKAYFQLGVLYSEKKDLPRAISSYESAVRIDHQMPEAHYRLAQAYAVAGDKEKSRKEIALYQQNSQEKVESAERERREVQQFVYTMKPAAETNP